jgi:hypothetical protein
MFILLSNSNSNENISFLDIDSIEKKFRALKPGNYQKYQSKSHFLMWNETFSKKIDLTESIFQIEVGYLINDENLKLTSLETSLKNAEGQFVVVRVDIVKNQISIATDSHATIPLFSASDQKLSAFTTHFESLFSLNIPLSVNFNSIDLFILQGIFLKRETLINEVKYYDKRSIVEIKDNKILVKKYLHNSSFHVNKDLSLNEASKLVFEVLKLILNDFKRIYSFERMFLSGGSDTRLLLSCLDRAELKRLTFICYESPSWSHSNYDAEIAQLLSDEFNLNLQLLSCGKDDSNSYSDYIRRSPLASKTLTGTFGSEIFGNVIFQNKPFKKLNKKDDDINTFTDAAKNSFISSLYAANGTLNFILPYMNHFANKAIPFTDSRLLTLVQGFPEEYLKDYKIYLNIFKNISSEFSKIPFHSSITLYSPDLPSISDIKKSWVFPENTLGDQNQSKLTKYFLKLYLGKQGLTEEEILLRSSILSRWFSEFTSLNYLNFF